MNTRHCPFPGCKHWILPKKFACAQCWARLTARQRRVICNAYADYLEETIGVEELRYVQRRIIAEGVRS